MSVTQTTIVPDTTDDPDFEAEIQEGIAAADAGRLLPWNQVEEWILSWGSDNELPPPGQSSSGPRLR